MSMIISAKRMLVGTPIIKQIWPKRLLTGDFPISDKCESPGSLPSNFVGFQFYPDSPSNLNNLIIKCLYSGNLPSSPPNYQPPSDTVSVGLPGVGRIYLAWNINNAHDDYRCYRYKLSPYETSSPTSSLTKNPVIATAAPTKKPVGGNPSTAAPTKKPVGGNPSPPGSATMKPTVSSKSSKGSKSGGTSGPNSKSAKNAKRV
eukprot:scaffold444_cov42-Cyclotella_meneghiniana.AAC.8